MELKLHKDRVEQIGYAKFKPFGISEESWSYNKLAYLDLRTLNPPQLAKLRELFESNKQVRGMNVLLYDLRCYERALKDTDSVRIRNCRTFTHLLKQHIEKHCPHKHLYHRLTDGEDAWIVYYVNEIKFHPKEQRRDGVIPEYTTMELVWEMFGGKFEKHYRWENHDLRDKHVSEVLAHDELYVETQERRDAYLKELQRYREVTQQIGKQFFAVGFGTDDVDGNDTDDRHWYRSTNRVAFERDDGASRVVIDVFRESDERERESRVDLDHEFWRTKVKATDNDEDEALEELDAEEAELETKRPYHDIEVPLHPFVVVFDLRRHLRLKTHLNNLTEYVYDKHLSEKLILPDESKHLVEILIAHQDGGFKDIVAGKGGGAVVLLCGPPGTGKTLTAEVYAESEEKALYSVQASQLGTNEEELERELLKVLARGKRWGAVMLLDEADVYVHSRGNDLQQNAIVGVFLRVLEYHSSILFLTTNRPESVDDAIASRCVARITYDTPTIENQKRIWRVLADGAGIPLQPSTVDKIVKDHSKLSGRDIKNLLKLAQLYARSRKEKITSEVVSFVKQFKPTLGGD